MTEKLKMKIPPAVNCRLKGWARYQDRVFVIVIDGNEVRIIQGFISSHPKTGDKIADNVNRTAVWGDQVFNDCADNADDAYERDFDVDNPLLLKKEEALILRDENIARMWFDGLYPPEMIKKITQGLSAQLKD